MKIAIHDGNGWNIKWQLYCKAEGIPYKLVNCYNTNIIQQLKDEGITHLMWHFHHLLFKDILIARSVLYSATKIGIKTFPDFNTCYHFDDKISQKYLLEAIGAPLVPSYVFYDKKEAMKWLKNEARYPLVAKLRRGAGSYNVCLLNNYKQAKTYTDKMFGRGLQPVPGYLADIKNKLKVASSLNGIIKRIKKAPNYFKIMYKGRHDFPNEKGYVYFQDFIAGNKEDIRIAVVGNKIWSFKRKVRAGDFRASGSGMIDYDTKNLPIQLIKRAFEVSQKLKAQSIAFDFVKDKSGNYYIVEMSYGYAGEVVYNCPGYWNESLVYEKGHIWPEIIIIQNFINQNI